MSISVALAVRVSLVYTGSGARVKEVMVGGELSTVMLSVDWVVFCELSVAVMVQDTTSLGCTIVLFKISESLLPRVLPVFWFSQE